MRMFFLNGRATLHKEVNGDKYNAPLDIYNHLLEEYLLRFSNPTVTEQKTTVFHYLKFRISGQHEIRGRLMSPIQVTAARTSKLFFFLTCSFCSNQFPTRFYKIFIFKRKKLRSFFCYGAQGCALRKISGSPLGSQAFYLRRPDLKVGHPNKNFREPYGLPSIPAGVPRPLKLVADVHLMGKYFVCTRILLPCWSPNSVFLAFGFDKNAHVFLWNPSKFSCHSDLKPETWAMPLNCLGFKEGKAKKFSRSTQTSLRSLGQT